MAIETSRYHLLGDFGQLVRSKWDNLHKPMVNPWDVPAGSPTMLNGINRVSLYHLPQPNGDHLLFVQGKINAVSDMELGYGIRRNPENNSIQSIDYTQRHPSGFILYSQEKKPFFYAITASAYSPTVCDILTSLKSQESEFTVDAILKTVKHLTYLSVMQRLCPQAS